MNPRRILLPASSLLFLVATAACGDDTGNGGGGASGTSSSQASSTTGATKSSATATSGSTTASNSASASNSTADTTASSSGSGSSSSTGGGPPMPYTININDAQTQEPVVGLNVCETGANPPNCALTDAAGDATLQIPSGVDFTLEYSNASYRKHLLRVRAGVDSTIFSLGISNTTAGLIFTLLGQTDDPTKGSIGGLITNGNMGTAGATAALVPASGTGPFYTQGGIPSTTPTMTSADGLFLMLNVNPGSPEVQATKTGTMCEPQIGVVGGTANATVVPVEAGAFTISSSFTCM